MTMKLVTWNIQWGLGMDGRCEIERIVAEAKRIADVDVLCLQEVADNFPDLAGSRGENQFEELARLLPDYAVVEGVATDLPGEGRARRRFGNVILSRYPVGRVLRHLLPLEADETQSMARVLIDAVVTTPFGPLRVMTTHLEYFSAKLRAAQIEGIRAIQALALARAAAPPMLGIGPYAPQAAPASAILTGDFNMKPDDRLKTSLCEPPAPGAPRLVDAWMALNAGRPHPPSFCIADQRYGPPHCCDYVFVTEDLLPRLRNITYETETRASDHQHVLLELSTS